MTHSGEDPGRREGGSEGTVLGHNSETIVDKRKRGLPENDNEEAGKFLIQLVLFARDCHRQRERERERERDPREKKVLLYHVGKPNKKKTFIPGDVLDTHHPKSIVRPLSVGYNMQGRCST